MKIAVIGLGHVGLPTALGLAELGWEVVGADDDREKVARISRGEVPFYEPGLRELLLRHLHRPDTPDDPIDPTDSMTRRHDHPECTGRFRVAPSVSDAIKACDVLFVCVGTPQREDGSADLSQVEAVARTIAQNLNGYKLIVEKSTTPVRTAERIKQTILRYCNSRSPHSSLLTPHFDVAVNPEFLREGTAVRDFFNPDRIVIGVESDRARDLLLQIYRPLFERSALQPANLPTSQPSNLELTNLQPANLVVTDLNTAEIIKHAANAFLAMKVSFINLVADLCEATGADVLEVARGLGLDPRIGPHFLQAGVGYGGYCLPKDLKAFIRIGEAHGVPMGLLREVERINEERSNRLVEKLRRSLWVLRGKTVAIWGLAFKPGTDDIREAPSLKVVQRLLEEGCLLRLYDPRAMEAFRLLFPEQADRITYASSPEVAAEGADALVLLTEWSEFREVDFRSLRERMAVPLVVDGRNFLDCAHLCSLGFEYYGMGRGRRDE